LKWKLLDLGARLSFCRKKENGRSCYFADAHLCSDSVLLVVQVSEQDLFIIKQLGQGACGTVCGQCMTKSMV
jgi:hypothetical protein